MTRIWESFKFTIPVLLWRTSRESLKARTKGQGSGHRFLKHIERTKVLIHVVDVSGSEGRDPMEDFDKINSELEAYSRNASEKAADRRGQ